MGKFLLSCAGFAAVFVGVRPLHAPAFFGAYIVLYVVNGVLLSAALEQLVLRNQELRQAGAAEQARAAREAGATLPGQALVPEAAAAQRRLHDAAEQSGLELAQGEYRLVDAKDARQRAYQFMFPVYGSYPEIREFLALALNNVPALALSSLCLRRESVESTELDAALGFTLYLEAAP